MASAPEYDQDPQETREWLEALEGVLETEGPERAHFLLEQLIEKARRSGAFLPYSANTAYINTIPPSKEERSPGDHEIEHRIRSYVRWNAAAMVLRANKNTNVGGHIASFASAATLYDVGFNHFWHTASNEHGGDLVFAQGHSAPGVYARAFMLGRLSAAQMDKYRQEVDGDGLSSYPHPWLMPDFWQFPTVSMGLGPIMAIYQARFMKYLDDRGLADTKGRKVWCFLGDGESDEPEAMGAIGVAASDLEALPDDGQPGVAGEGAATGAEFDVGHGTVWVNGDIRYIAMQFSRLEAFLGGDLTDSGKKEDVSE